jgi:hypothetical protein
MAFPIQQDLPSALRASVALAADRDASVAAASSEPASSQVQNLLISKQKRAPLRGTLVCLVAGACYTNYMQIEIEPFPLVA